MGFELTTLCSQSRCATRLRYAPTKPAILQREIPHLLDGAWFFEVDCVQDDAELAQMRRSKAGLRADSTPWQVNACTFTLRVGTKSPWKVLKSELHDQMGGLLPAHFFWSIAFDAPVGGAGDPHFLKQEHTQQWHGKTQLSRPSPD